MDDTSLKNYINSCQDYYLRPGYVFATQTPTVFRTILGSCVSVCIHDNRLKIAGINHFLLPESTDGEQTHRYGKPAVLALIRSMIKLGSKKQDLVAQIVGGARADEQAKLLAVGHTNIVVARNTLADLGIPIHYENVGGTLGRKLLYIGELNRIVVIKLKNNTQHTL